MKSRSYDIIRRFRTGDFALPRPYPSRGTSPSPREVFDRTTFFSIPAPLDSGLRRNDEWGAGLASAGAVVCGHSRGRERSFSYQSLIPACAGTPRDEKPQLRLATANWHGAFCYAPPRPQRGTSPRATLALGRLLPISRLTFAAWDSCVDSRLRGNDDWGAGIGGLRTAIEGPGTSFSYQSLMPASAGTPRYENPELRL